jgi:CLASP N terminal
MTQLKPGLSLSLSLSPSPLHLTHSHTCTVLSFPPPPSLSPSLSSLGILQDPMGGPDLPEYEETEQIDVVGPDDLERELTRLMRFLGDIASPWQSRTAALHRFQAIITARVAINLPNFVTVLQSFKDGLAVQLTDRRSKIVKEASVTLSILTRSMKQVQLSSEDQLGFVVALCHCLQHLYITLPQTVRVIAEAGRAGVREILEHVQVDAENTLLKEVSDAAMNHKHPAVRATCLEGVAILLTKFPKKQELSSPPADLDVKDFDAIPATLPDPDDPQQLISYIQFVINAGIRDGSADSRAFARLALMELQQVSPTHAYAIIASFNPAAIRRYEEELSDRMLGLLGKPAPKKRVRKTKPSRSSLRSRIARDRAKKSGRNKRAAANTDGGGNAGDVAVVVAPRRRTPKTTKTTKTTGSDVVHTPSAKSTKRADAVMAAAPAEDSKGSASDSSQSPSPRSQKRNSKSARRVHHSRGHSRGSASSQASMMESSPLVKRASGRFTDEILSHINLAMSKSSESVGSLAREAVPEHPEEQDMSLLATAPVHTLGPALARARATSIDASDLERADAVVRAPIQTEEQLAKNYGLISKLLDLDNPQITDRMLDFLLQEGVMDSLMGFISRRTPHQLHELVTAEVDMYCCTERGASPTPIQPLSPTKAQPNRRTSNADADPDDSKVGRFVDDNLAPARNRPRPASDHDETATRRSYRAMTLLCEHNNALLTVLSRRLRVVLMHLLSCFHPSSKANFYHTCAVWSQVVRWLPGEVLDIVLTTEGGAMFRHVFQNLHEPPVGDGVLDFLCSEGPRTKQQTLFKTMLSKWNAMRTITRRICDPQETQAASSYNALFLTQFLDRMIVHHHSVMLISSICAPGGLVDSLIDAVCDESSTRPMWQRLQCATLLSTLLKRSAPAKVNAPQSPNRRARVLFGNTKLVANKFSEVFPVLLKKIEPVLDRLNAGLSAVLSPSTSSDNLVPHATEVKHSSTDATATAAATAAATVTVTATATASDTTATGTGTETDDQKHHPLTHGAMATSSQLRVAMLDILCEMCKGNRSLIVRIPTETWSVLLQWFFESRQNSILLARFRILLVIAMQDYDNDLIMTFLMVRKKLLDSMIDFYTADTQSKCALHGFILEICNHLRLSYDVSPPGSFLHSFLGRSTKWQQFLPQLRRETLRQVGKWPATDDTSTTGDLSSTMPLISAPSVQDMTDMEDWSMPGDVNGIDIGSNFAHRLGYSQDISDMRARGRSVHKTQAELAARQQHQP